VLGLPLLSEQYSRLGSEQDRSEILDELDLEHRRLLVRPFLDFTDDEERLRQIAMFEKKRDVGEVRELSKEYIIKTYSLSKRKENACIDQLTDEKIRIFCADHDSDILDQLKQMDRDKTTKKKVQRKELAEVERSQQRR